MELVATKDLRFTDATIVKGEIVEWFEVDCPDRAVAACLKRVLQERGESRKRKPSAVIIRDGGGRWRVVDRSDLERP